MVLIDFIQYNAIENPDKVGGKIKLRHPIPLTFLFSRTQCPLDHSFNTVGSAEIKDS